MKTKLIVLLGAVLVSGLLTPSALAQTAVWNTNGGSWNTSGNWDTGVVPNTSTSIASFVRDFTATPTITLDNASGFTINRLNFDDTGGGTDVSMTINVGSPTGGTITFAGTTPTADIRATTVTINPAATLGTGFNKIGAGTLVLNGALTGWSDSMVNNVTVGQLTLGAASGASFTWAGVSKTTGAGTAQYNAVTAGEFTLPASYSVGAGGIAINGAGTYDGTAGFTKSGAGTLTIGTATTNAAGTFDVTGTLQFNGVVAGSSGLTKAGAGTLVLNNTANTLTSSFTVSAGVLQIRDGSTNTPTFLTAGALAADTITVKSGAILDLPRLHASTATTTTWTLPPVTLEDGAKLRFRNSTGSNAHAMAANLATSGTTTIDSNGGAYSHSISMSGAISGSGLINYLATTNSGSGVAVYRTLALSNIGTTYSGNWFVDYSVASADDWVAIQSNAVGAVGTGTVTLDDRARLINNTANGINSLAGVVLQKATSYLDLNGTNAWTSTGASLTAQNGTVNLGTGASTIGALTIDSTGTVTIDTTGGGTLEATTMEIKQGTVTGTGTLTGGGTLTKTGPGSAVIAIANTGTGTTWIQAGTLTVGNGGTSGSLPSGDITDDGVLGFNRSDDITPTQAIAGAGSLAKSGAGKLTLSGSVSYAGGTTLSAGTLALDYSTNDTSKLSDTATLTLGSGTLDLVGGTHGEAVGDTLVSGTASLTRSSGAAVIHLGTITRSGSGALNLPVGGIATTTLSLEPSGALPSWITVAGGPSTKDGSGFIVAFAGFADVFRLGGAISDNPTALVRIIDGGTSGPVFMAAAGTTTVSTLTQSATAGAATIDIGTDNILRLGVDGKIQLDAAAGALSFTNTGTLTAGGADNTAGTVIVLNDSPVSIAALIADNGTGGVAVTKSGASSLELAGTNTYTGGTTLNAGELKLANAGALGAGPLTINGGTIDNSFGSALTLANGTNQTWASNVVFTGTSDLTFGTGTITMTGNRQVTVAAGTLTESGSLTGAFTLTKAGPGTLVLAGGTWTGTTTVAAGTLEVNGRPTSDVTYAIAQGATLKLGYSTFGQGAYTPAITVNGNGVADPSGLYLLGGKTVSANAGLILQTAPSSIRSYGTGTAYLRGFDVNSDYHLTNTAAASGSIVEAGVGFSTGSYGYKVVTNPGASTATGDIVLQGPITGTAGATVGGEAIPTALDKRGTGSLALSGASTYTLGTSINAGSIIVTGGDNRLPVGTTVALGNGTASGKLILDGIAQTVADILANGTGTANAVLGGSATQATLTVNYSGTGRSFSGFVGGAGTNENNLGLTKSGTGALTLTAANTYTGPTLVNNGILRINGSLSAASAVTVSAAGTLGGTGSVPGNIVAAGTIAPGASAGTLTTGPVTLTGTLAIEIDGTSADKLLSTGAIDLSGSTLSVTLLAGGFTQSSYVIAEGASLTGTFATVPAGYQVTYTATQAVLSRSGYTSWASNPANGLIAGVNDGPTDDPDGDGIPNLLEYVLGGLPAGTGAANTAVLPQAGKSGSDLVLTFNRSDDSETDTTQMIESGTTLSGWSAPVTVPASSGTVSGLTFTIGEGTPATNPDTISVAIPTGGAPGFFARLKVTKP